MINGHNPNQKIQQKLDCGAVVRLDDAVIEHGVIFIHPELPPMRLLFKMDPEGKKLPAYGIEPIAPEHGDKTQFAIVVHEVAEKIVMPETPKLIV